MEPKHRRGPARGERLKDRAGRQAANLGRTEAAERSWAVSRQTPAPAAAGRGPTHQGEVQELE